MTEGKFKKLTAQLQPLVDIERALGGNNALARIAKDMEHQKNVLSAAYGPVEELRRSGVLAALTEQGGNFAELQKQLALSTDRFKLPEFKLATELMEAYRADHASELVKHFKDHQDYLRRATEAIRSPWLDMQAQMRSVGAFADIQSMGFALHNIPAFDDRLTELLRLDLGDWQDRINFPKKIFDDPLARSAFYQERGFDPALTAFPTDAFGESLDIAGLRGAPAPIIDAYDYEEVREEDEQEAEFARTNAAHGRLQRFETQLRQFIDEQMTKAFGDQWIKHHVPGDMRKSWIDKRERARANGEVDHPLIAYADFSDYVPIITQKNNWNEVFKPVFSRPTFVQESFQRLYPIRICTMHARMITQDDELYLYVETKRVLSAIGIE
ncbi:Swt1 family HEPN domain-containing protein [Salibaculum sp.]|uniref:Swt1 family HEPN domain-containing protein n=1 Tax=Salibaculum sp. TaxID=2855480 RepID=UPI002B46CB90|nr:Swt1 family HEPN domain-containing protein [Salibaculum sp.]HKL70744.1 Swt1 family HEPN domain-containing protein [Salibaculum sp.]